MAIGPRSGWACRAGYVPAALVVSATLLAGCGGGSSGAGGQATATSTAGGEPAYCASLNQLEQSVALLKPGNLAANGTNGLKSAVSQVKTDATAVVDDAKAAFADQTAALRTAVDALGASVEGLASSPTRAQLAAIPEQMTAVITAAKSLKTSASPKCK
jgi:hypothetical protein